METQTVVVDTAINIHGAKISNAKITTNNCAKF